jgi:hypothetical protein
MILPWFRIHIGVLVGYFAPGEINPGDFIVGLLNVVPCDD